MSGDKMINVKYYKRGAYHDEGVPMMCITCRIEKKLEEHTRKRANQAVVSLVRVRESGSRLSVGYCEEHIPEELEV